MDRKGDTLGPLFFIVFINHIRHYPIHCKFLIIAVDIKMFLEVTTSLDCATLQDYLNHLSNYFLLEGLSVKLSKYASISYTTNKLIINYINHIDGHNLSVVSEVNDMGVTLGSKLLFQEHIKKLLNWSNKLFGFIPRTTRDLINGQAIYNLC